MSDVVAQGNDWDCGIACVATFFRSAALTDPSSKNFIRRIKIDLSLELLRSLVGTENVWTIDLFMLLHRLRHGLRSLAINAGGEPSILHTLPPIYEMEYATICAGVNEAYRQDV